MQAKDGHVLFPKNGYIYHKVYLLHTVWPFQACRIKAIQVCGGFLRCVIKEDIGLTWEFSFIK